MATEQNTTPTIEWLLPLIGGVIGAATPGLGRGVSLASSIANAIEQRKQNRLYRERTRQLMESDAEKLAQERAAREAAAQLATSMAVPSTTVPLPGQGEGAPPTGFGFAGSPPSPQSIMPLLAMISPNYAAQMAQTMVPKPGIPIEEIPSIAKTLPQGTTLGLPVAGAGGQAYLHSTQKPPELVAIMDENSQPRYVPAEQAVNAQPYYPSVAARTQRPQKPQPKARTSTQASLKSTKAMTPSQQLALLKYYEKQADALEEQALTLQTVGQIDRADVMLRRAEELRSKAATIQQRLDEQAGLAEPSQPAEGAPQMVPSHGPRAEGGAQGTRSKPVNVIYFDASGRRIN